MRLAPVPASMQDRDNHSGESTQSPGAGLPEVDQPASSECRQIRRRAGWLGLGLLAAGLALSFLLPLGEPGIWDPPELEVAELSRRIAVSLLGADDLRLSHLVNQVPTRRELGRGELPFTSIALGFRLFGLSDWAGRLPLALWGLMGIAATYLLVSRLLDRGAARVSALLLGVTPLYFVQARTMLGDAASLACMALASAGLGIGALDSRLTPSRRALVCCLGLVGLTAGFWCRGLLLGVGLPLVSVSAARLAALRRSRRGKLRLGAADWCLLAGTTLSVLVGAGALWAAAQGADYSVFAGMSRGPGDPPPSHDVVLQHLGHALFPISVLLPFSLACLLDAHVDPSELGLRVLVLTAIVVGVAAYTLVAPFAGMLPFAPTFACAISVGLMLRSLSKQHFGSRVFAMSVAALGLLLFLDFKERPETVFEAYAVGNAHFPDSFSSRHDTTWVLGTLGMLAVLFFCLVEAPPSGKAAVGWRRDYLVYLRAIRVSFKGRLWLLSVMIAAALFAWALAVALGERVLDLWMLEPTWSVTRTIASHAWWVFLALALGLPLVVLVLRDAIRWLSRPRPARSVLEVARNWLGSRSGVATTAIASFGGVLSVSYYPALAAQLSPKRTFAVYAEISKSGEPLGVLGVAESLARYYAGRNAHWLESPGAASNWLDSGRGRRFLITRASDLPELNARYRARFSPRRNLPVLDARSSELFLVSNRLGERVNRNPFESMLLARRPSVQHPLDANLGHRLEVVGWELVDDTGVLARELRPGRPYELRLVYEVVGHLSDDWETFVHIDGYGRRFNADHAPLEGKYSLGLLQPGDVIVDRHRMVVDPNFTPGNYELYFGLYRGNRRLPVERGAHDANRLDAGTFRIR